MANILTQKPVAIGPFFEVSNAFCREEVELERGHEYPAGLILGRIDGGAYAPHDPSSGDGRQIEAGVLVFRLPPSDTKPLSGPKLRASALVRGPVAIGANQLARHRDIKDPQPIAAQNAAMPKLNILVKEQV